jgi:hypothetical protein
LLQCQVVLQQLRRGKMTGRVRWLQLHRRNASRDAVATHASHFVHPLWTIEFGRHVVAKY